MKRKKFNTSRRCVYKAVSGDWCAHHMVRGICRVAECEFFVDRNPKEKPTRKSHVRIVELVDLGYNDAIIEQDLRDKNMPLSRERIRQIRNMYRPGVATMMYNQRACVPSATEEFIGQLIELSKDFSMPEIAEILGVPYSRVAYVCGHLKIKCARADYSKYGLKKRKFIDKDTYWKLHKSGMTERRIAKALGVSRKSLIDWIRRENIRPIKTHFVTHVGCNVDGCTDRHYARGLCRIHHSQLRMKKQLKAYVEDEFLKVLGVK
jgi:predicted XRE-type DNA-binding protein